MLSSKPVFRPDGIDVEGPKKIEVGETVKFTASGQQPTKEGPDVRLPLRGPDPSRPNADHLTDPALSS